jgi:hypothetical protein
LLCTLLVVLCLSASSFAQVGIAVSFGPPPLPVYQQPLCPSDGYIWTPGYWAWDPDFGDYYWVPGTWVMAPEVGLFWTPGYWGWGDGGFFWNTGYWGPVVGFYGGINYGFGYFGNGFYGGRWDHGHFFYNRSVTNINITNIHNVYETRVDHNENNHVSFNGGNGGINVRPTPEQEAAARERRMGPTSIQEQHVREAQRDPQQRASVNMGKPPVAASAKPAEFHGNGVVAAREAGGKYTPPPNHGNNNAHPTSYTHVRDLPTDERPTAPNTGNAKQDKKNAQQMQKQYQQQQKEREKLASQQQKEDQRMSKQNSQEAQRQATEQRHMQQTMQMQQRHTQQQQQMQQRMTPHTSAPESHGPPPERH